MPIFTLFVNVPELHNNTFSVQSQKLILLFLQTTIGMRSLQNTKKCKFLFKIIKKIDYEKQSSNKFLFD